jgi:hypothetical protein
MLAAQEGRGEEFVTRAPDPIEEAQKAAWAKVVRLLDDGGGPQFENFCLSCNVYAPCPTMRIVNGIE